MNGKENKVMIMKKTQFKIEIDLIKDEFFS